MIAARRAARGAYDPRKFAVIVMVITALVLIAAFFASAQSHPAAPGPTQAGAHTPQPTWTTYIPTTPEVCRDAMDAADAAIEQAEDRYTSTLKAAQLGNDDNPGGAEKQIKIAQQAHEDLTKTIGAYMKKAKECKK